MNRENIAKEIIRRYNNREGTITNLAEQHEGYSRHKFYRDIEKLGITKEKETDKFIIPDGNIEGQLNLLEQEGPELQEKEISRAIEPIRDTERQKERKAQSMEKKKKTFEIDVELEQLIRIQAAIKDTTINEWVNKILWAAIPEDTRRIVKD
jgi:predicted HicB family RNase H-like nuclease